MADRPGLLASLRHLASESDIAWCVAPVMAVAVAAGPVAEGPPSRVRSLTAVVRGGAAVGMTAQDGVLAVATTENQRRVLAPILRALGGEWAGGRTPPLLRRDVNFLRSYARRERAARAVTRDLTRAIDAEAPGSVSPHHVLDRCLAAARALTRAEQVLKVCDPTLVVIASQHDIVARASLVAANRIGTTTAYIPHAPAARVSWYQDLPVHVALLRGQAEVDFYARLGARPDRLYAVGNAAVTVDDSWSGEPAGDARPVVALSPHRPERVRVLLSAARSAAQDPWWVAAHPRQDEHVLRQAISPPLERWRGKRTFDLLRAGATVVVQDSSGIAWEALALGLPVVQFNATDAEAPYPLLDSSLIPGVGTAAALREAVEQAGLLVRDPAYRHQLRALAAAWCSLTGEASARAAADILRLHAASGTVPECLVLDRWGERGQ